MVLVSCLASLCRLSCCGDTLTLLLASAACWHQHRTTVVSVAKVNPTEQAQKAKPRTSSREDLKRLRCFWFCFMVMKLASLANINYWFHSANVRGNASTLLHKNIMSLTVFPMHFFPLSFMETFSLGLEGARQFPGIVQNFLTVQGFEAHVCV